MAGEHQTQGDEQEQQNQDPDPDLDLKPFSPSSSSSDSDTDSDSGAAPGSGRGEGGREGAETDDSPETNFRSFAKVLDSKSVQRRLDEEYEYYEDQFAFPPDLENWREEDLRELWADAPLESTKPVWDPVWADDEDWDIVHDEIREGRDPPRAPFYIPYRKALPSVPDNQIDITGPKFVIEELYRIEEFLKWVSYVFPNGSTYEGTVWDDLAHGKGVNVAEQGLVRYEGEWLQNNMEGHGVVEVDIPDVEPIPGWKLRCAQKAKSYPGIFCLLRTKNGWKWI